MFSTPNVFRFLVPAAALVFAMPVMSPVSLAQEAQPDADVEEIITTGTRRSERSASDSAVPIDVIGGQELVNIGTTDLNELLRNTVPSYNVQSHSIDDAATLVRPATMRGLPPDNVLIMVNGKRRHRSGVIAELGSSLNEGSQGADISAIPALAIKQVEVLRDGAAAQYGSDAIAGVINIITAKPEARSFQVTVTSLPLTETPVATAAPSLSKLAASTAPGARENVSSVVCPLGSEFRSWSAEVSTAFESPELPPPPQAASRKSVERSTGQRARFWVGMRSPGGGNRPTLSAGGAQPISGRIGPTLERPERGGPAFP